MLFPLNHFATPDYWFHYRRLKPELREMADTKFKLLQADPRHPSLRLKKIGIFWSVRIGQGHRALARDRPEGLSRFWIGGHDEYERILNK